MSEIPWFKVDDTLAFHAKVVAAGNAAMGLWVRSGAWSGQQLNDGFIPAHMAALLGTPQQAARLVRSGLWHEVDGGFSFHEWDERQPKKQEIVAERAAGAERKRLSRARRNGTNPETPLVNGHSHTEVTPDAEVASQRPDPTRPDPTRIKDTSSSEVASDPDANPRPEVVDLCQHLADRVRENGHKVPAKLGKAWFRPCRLMLDRDEYTADQIRKAIDWATADGFWSSNIRSMQTLREKYTVLRAQAQGAKRGAAPIEPPRYVPPYEGDPDDLDAYNEHYARWGKAS